MKDEMTIQDVIAVCEAVFEKLTIDPLRAEFSLQVILQMCDGNSSLNEIKEMALFGLARH